MREESMEAAWGFCVGAEVVVVMAAEVVVEEEEGDFELGVDGRSRERR